MSEVLNILSLTGDGMAKLYADRVEPILRVQEENRRAAMKTFQFRVALTALATALGGAFIWWIFADLEAVFFACVVAVAGGGALAYMPLQAVASATKAQSLTAVANAIGCTYQGAGFEPEALPAFNELKLLPSCDRSNYEDCFGGSHHGCKFAFYEGHLENKVQSKNGTRWVTVFRGQLIRVAFPKKFHGTTIIRRDRGMFNFMQRWMSTMQHVGLVDSRLEKAFEVFSNDQVEARYLIHPVFMERLLELETAFKGKNLRGAFVEGDLLIAIEGGDKFEVGSMFSNLNDIARARSIVGDITEVMRVIDAVLTAEQGALPQNQAPNESGPGDQPGPGI
jgi:hypothetical protein